MGCPEMLCVSADFVLSQYTKSMLMTYGQLVSAFYEQESKKDGKHLLGHVIFSQDSFTRPYSEATRTYIISSNC